MPLVFRIGIWITRIAIIVGLGVWAGFAFADEPEVHASVQSFDTPVIGPK